MRKGFDFFKTNLGSVSYDLESIIQLPKIYKLFTKSFEVSSDSLLLDGILDEDDDFERIGSIKINLQNESEIYLENFLSSSDIIEQWEVSKQETEWQQYKLLRIAFLGQGGFGGLYLGCDESNTDEIWIYNSDNEPPFSKIDDNIFDFVKRLEFSKDFSNINDGDYQSLYKNWGDEIWKVRD